MRIANVEIEDVDVRVIEVVVELDAVDLYAHGNALRGKAVMIRPSSHSVYGHLQPHTGSHSVPVEPFFVCVFARAPTCGKRDRLEHCLLEFDKHWMPNDDVVPPLFAKYDTPPFGIEHCCEHSSMLGPVGRLHKGPKVTCQLIPNSFTQSSQSWKRPKSPTFCTAIPSVRHCGLNRFSRWPGEFSQPSSATRGARSGPSAR